MRSGISKISRRAFLFGVVLAGIGTSLAGLLCFRLFRYEHLIKAVLKKRLHYLTLDSSGVDRFTQDLVRSTPFHTLPNASFLQTFALVYKHTNLIETTPLQGRFYVFEHWVIERYMLSSDFFLNDEDETRPVHYLGLYHPYENPCHSPFPSKLSQA
ncbi:MAG: hypothetical protein KDD55_09175 [Bdellovibrionales bacterium]|nr:hypothetical protein [Bdellovibrionales bacterium]